MQHPAVTEASVVGRYSEELATELPAAFVRLGQEHRMKTIDADKQKQLCQDIQAFVNDRVADPRRLRGGVFIVDTFPRTSFGKIIQKKLKNQYFGRDS